MPSTHTTPAPSTPGKPKSSGSRQQTHAGQTSQTGSPKLDRDQKDEKQGGKPLPKPPNAK